MEPRYLWLFVIGVGLMAAFPAILLVTIQPGPPAPVSPCPFVPGARSSLSVPAGQTVEMGSISVSGSQWRWSIWTISSSPYALFLLTQDQYDSYAANGSGFNGSVHYSPPASFYWTSGRLTSTNDTFLFGSGTWYLMVYNPGNATAAVSVEAAMCNAT